MYSNPHVFRGVRKGLQRLSRLPKISDRARLDPTLQTQGALFLFHHTATYV